MSLRTYFTRREYLKALLLFKGFSNVDANEIANIYHTDDCDEAQVDKLRQEMVREFHESTDIAALTRHLQSIVSGAQSNGNWLAAAIAASSLAELVCLSKSQLLFDPFKTD